MLYMNFDQNWSSGFCLTTSVIYLLAIICGGWSHCCQNCNDPFPIMLVPIMCFLKRWNFIWNYRNPLKNKCLHVKLAESQTSLLWRVVKTASYRANLWAKQLCLLPHFSPDRSVNILFLHFISGHLILEHGHEPMTVKSIQWPLENPVNCRDMKSSLLDGLSSNAGNKTCKYQLTGYDRTIKRCQEWTQPFRTINNHVPSVNETWKVASRPPAVWYEFTAKPPDCQ